MDLRPSALDPRHGEYASRFNRVLDYIQEHLAKDMSLETLAAVACFSRFHFHRLFHGWTGETVHDFISRLRVERAANQLIQNPRKSITEIALDCGFSSSSTFARAFKAFHGVSASEWRTNRKIRNTYRKDGKAGDRAEYPSLDATDGFGPFREVPMTIPLQIEVKQLPPVKAAYVRHIGPYQKNAALFERLFGQLCSWAGPRGLLGPQTKYLSIYHDNPEVTEPAKLRLDVAITVPDAVKVEGEIGKQSLPGGKYVVARARIHPDQFGEAWDALMGGWFPGSGYQPDDRPCFESYLNDPNQDPERMHDVEICAPVVPL